MCGWVWWWGVSGFFQVVLVVWSGWVCRVGVIREYGTGRWGLGDADEMTVRCLLGVLVLC